jgi:hypothetical protein
MENPEESPKFGAVSPFRRAGKAHARIALSRTSDGGGDRCSYATGGRDQRQTQVKFSQWEALPDSDKPRTAGYEET